MGVILNFSLYDKNNFRKKIGNMVRKLKNKKELFSHIGVIGLKDIMEHFQREESPEGKWKKSLRARIQGGQTLQDTGKLRASIDWNADNEGVNIGTNRKYAMIHQFGGVIKARTKPYLQFKIKGGGWVKKKEVHIPKREFLWLSDRAIGKIENEVLRYVSD